MPPRPGPGNCPSTIEVATMFVPVTVPRTMSVSPTWMSVIAMAVPAFMNDPRADGVLELELPGTGGAGGAAIFVIFALLASTV